MRIAVFGAGGVGGYFGGRLAQAGEDVVFIARGDHLKALQANGLAVQSINGSFTLDTVEATDDPSGLRAVDVVIVAVKSWQVPLAAQGMKPVMGKNTYVLPLLNGVEATPQLAEVVGCDAVLKGMAKIISRIAGPGEVHHVGAEPYIALGEPDNHTSDRAERLREALEKAGVRAEIPPDIDVALWEKFLLVASLGGVGAVTRAPVGVLRELPETRRMLEEAMAEILRVAHASTIDVDQDAIPRSLRFIDGLPANGTTSLQRDILEGLPSELDAWSGAVVRLAKEVGVQTPIHDFIHRSLLPLERRARAGSLTWSLEQA
jgi:2-dehydropantoate 2-reductase